MADSGAVFQQPDKPDRDGRSQLSLNQVFGEQFLRASTKSNPVDQGIENRLYNLENPIILPISKRNSANVPHLKVANSPVEKRQAGISVAPCGNPPFRKKALTPSL